MTRRFWTTATFALALATAAACGKKDDATETGMGTNAPAATTAAVAVDEIRVGKAIGADKRVTDETNDFRPTETIYASVRTTGTAPSATLVARWTFQDGQVVSEDTRNIAPTGTAVTEFSVSKPDGFPAGNYKVEILLDGRSVGTKDFEVK
jgi:hypothetical protein